MPRPFFSRINRPRVAAGRPNRQRGLTLVELLVVLAIIASLAAVIYPAVNDSLKKSQASLIAQRIDAVQKAKVQYQLDLQTESTTGNGGAQITGVNDGDDANLTALLRYLTRFGQSIKGPEDLNQGTGGTIVLGKWGGNAYYTPGSGSINPYVAKYNIPTADTYTSTSSTK